ncbi:hypothetical protein GE21DRAFT_6733 [Neurospora crassa]|uniref:Uncharacterized protein n=1 Tax=Neurospora crassa (strain ATCC 24698 / 74-OR23-1A / CBS 708.71 / DSM 1257 / FGSC 987) TaxID=367110 RepID=Q7S9C9_NEUCR|nr:hypothetical protein NCU05203 [Neurospora crassa OR74A]EAA32966.1 hypothetical protein NCU05203 [Neurospora crassa OR74A]KHE85412.1 hypothetical protein GE21DRAFT_6733 [Neurospora crassa]|eukprot:XP_962202.1 hypothetical protein NCU05203 [Neurospora crassa OR74A]
MTAANPSPPRSNQSTPSSDNTDGDTLLPPLRPKPRTLPPWIDSYEERYGQPSTGQGGILNRPPPRTVQPQHNGTPTEPRRVSKDGFVYEPDGLERRNDSKMKLRRILRRGDGMERGRKWDHLRTDEPVILHRNAHYTSNSPWSEFIHSSQWGHMPNEQSEVVDYQTLEKLQPNLNLPVHLPESEDVYKSRTGRRSALYKRLWQHVLRHPLVPLLFRSLVLITSICALALAIRIYQLEGRRRSNQQELQNQILARLRALHSASNSEGYVDQELSLIRQISPGSSERTQAIVAIAVDTIAIPYIGYMLWDEYTGRPLGLRPVTQKSGLVLMDVFFIVFKAASTALAYEVLVYHNSQDRFTDHFSQALAAFQLLGLFFWLTNFTVNVFRLVVKLGGGDDLETQRGR